MWPFSVTCPQWTNCCWEALLLQGSQPIWRKLKWEEELGFVYWAIGLHCAVFGTQFMSSNLCGNCDLLNWRTPTFASRISFLPSFAFQFDRRCFDILVVKSLARGHELRLCPTRETIGQGVRKFDRCIRWGPLCLGSEMVRLVVDHNSLMHHPRCYYTNNSKLWAYLLSVAMHISNPILHPPDQCLN